MDWQAWRNIPYGSQILKIVKGFKEDREDAAVDVDKCKLEIININKRIKLVETEYELPRGHKEEFVDSAVWYQVWCNASRPKR